ncbi:MAG: chemotaxis response regulator protein-glutamate methylesterase [Firmicutes bacterium]|jgi:two-component system chemotaxis response regulator CheB|nr:chemotaxis response regulator protein-glutamate methylesterase [Bacillota bacterium]
MAAKEKIKVLVVDDSLVSREVIARGLALDVQIEIVGKAVDPFDARDKIVALRPDVMTCDIEMPRMNGIEFIRRLLPQYPLPVVVVSSISSAVFEALNAGAVDFVTKPDFSSPTAVENFIKELINKVKIASRAQVKTAPPLLLRQSGGPQTTVAADKIIAIGASTGGTEAIYQLLKQLPAKMPAIVIVQHIPAVFSRLFAERLNQQLPFRVKEAVSGDYLDPGTVLIAPGDYHLQVRRSGTRYQAVVEQGERVNGHCPSVDVLFTSVAKEVGEKAIGVILTGMGYDGARGLLAMRRKGAKTVGQDEASSVVYGMPKAAFELGAVEIQAPLAKIPQILLSLVSR